MKVIAVLPAFNAENTLKQTVNDISRTDVAEIILVDDCSSDKTYEIAKEMGLTAIRHDVNKGYGGNQKTCYKEALNAGADIVVMVHPDYQYDPRVISVLTSIIEKDICDVMLGCRIRTRAEAMKGGMPFYKYLFNRILTFVENFFTGENLGEWHSGMRAYSRKVLETIRWEDNSDDFVFDSQFLLQAAAAGFRIGDIPVAVKYFKEASSINFMRSMWYGIATLYYLARYLMHKLHLVNCRLLQPK